MNLSGNPYVGPRTFEEKDKRLFFGRQSEARDLAARIISERLLLFYAQSGAGKSSLINTRIIPWLRDEEHFYVLPVGRVSGELLEAAQTVNNIYAFNLMKILDQSGEDPNRLAQVLLSDFLARLARKVDIDEEGERVPRWIYRPDITPDKRAGGAKRSGPGPRFVLFIDQFEEIITSHPDHWQEREAFFEQLNQALVDDHNLWVVLIMRGDFAAALNPYAPLLFNRLRARFYMERMDDKSALEAIRRPAKLGGRPFAPKVAEQLVDNLRQVRVPGRNDTIGQYVEPVQLQVVCQKLWVNLEKGNWGSGGSEQYEITLQDLEKAGDVNLALGQFYEDSLEKVPAELVDNRQLRSWFEKELITTAGTRGLVYQGNERAGSMPNAAVRILQSQFLVRTHVRSGGIWVELVHDSFVEPIRKSNEAWFKEHLSVLQRQALIWDSENRPEDLLLRGKALNEVEKSTDEQSLQPYEKKFLKSSRNADREALKQARKLSLVMAGLLALVVIALGIALYNYNRANEQRLIAEFQRDTAERQSLIAENEADNRATSEALADNSAADALNQKSTAESARALADNSAKDALNQKSTAESARAVAVSALQTTEADKIFALAVKATADAAAVVLSSPAALTPGGDLNRTPILVQTPTPDPTTIALQTDLSQNQATQTRLAGLTTALSDEVYILANWVGITGLSDHDPDATEVMGLEPWQRARVLDVTKAPWLFVEAPDGTRGWVDGGWRIFEGNADALPESLKRRVITERDDLPFVYGEVVSSGGPQDLYHLREQPDIDTRSIVKIPIGTKVIRLQVEQGASGEWSYVTFADPNSDHWVWMGYIPTVILAETAAFGQAEPTVTPTPS